MLLYSIFKNLQLLTSILTILLLPSKPYNIIYSLTSLTPVVCSNYKKLTARFNYYHISQHSLPFHHNLGILSFFSLYIEHSKY